MKIRSLTTSCGDIFLTSRHNNLTCQHKDLTRRHKDLTSRHNYLTSDGRNMPPYVPNVNVCQMIGVDKSSNF